MLKHILVGYDGGETALRAFRFAMELAALSEGKVRVVMALRVTETGGDTGSLLMTDTSEERARQLLDELTRDASAKWAPFEVEVIHGNPGDALLAQVEQHGIDHIVIGHTEHGALARWLLGSVSTQMLSRARVPVTVVR